MGITLNIMYLPLTMGPAYAEIWSIWGGLQYVVPLSWLNASVIVLEHLSGTYNKSVTTPRINGWAHTTLNTMHISLTLGPGYAKI